MDDIDENDKLCLFINLYNMLTIHATVVQGKKKYKLIKNKKKLKIKKNLKIKKIKKKLKKN